MKTRITTLLAIGACVLLLGAGSQAFACSGSNCGMAMDGHQIAASDVHQEMSSMQEGHQMTGMSALHGGEGHVTGPYQFESVFTESDVRLYVTRTDGMPVDPQKLSGTATITGPERKAATVKFAVKKVANDSMALHRHMAGVTDNATAYLSAPYTFGTLPDQAVKVDFAIAGLTGTKDESAEWQQEFVMTPLFGNACPMHSDQAALSDGTCSVCGGMALQPARVLYGCCPGCPDMRSTSPATCEQCGMEMNLKSVGKVDSPKSDHGEHHMNKGQMDHSG